MELHADQLKAYDELNLFAMARQPVHALCGPAGTGKTFLLKHFVAEQMVHGRTIHVCATTHKAAAVAGKAVGAPAGTIHSLLGVKPENDYTNGRQKLKRKFKLKVLPRSIIIVDESSMIDWDLLEMIRETAASLSAQVLFVGDSFQLPPVFNSKCPVFETVYPQSHLTEIKRQHIESPLIDVATEFRLVLDNDGEEFPRIVTTTNDKGRVIQMADPLAFNLRVLQEFKSDDYTRNPDHCRVLTWTNRAALSYNRLVRQAIRGTDDPTPVFGERLLANDAIMDPEDEDSVLFSNNELLTVLDVKRTERLGIDGFQLLVSSDEDDGSIFSPLAWRTPWRSRIRRVEKVKH